jgi:transposase-like protein
MRRAIKRYKRYRSRSEREAMVAEYVESGQSQAEFCDERGIGVSTLQYWLRRTAELEEEEAARGSAGGSGFVELKVESAEGSREGERSSRAGLPEYELVLANSRRLIVRSGVEVSEVTALIRVLEERS